MDITVIGTSRHAMKPERATLHLSVGCEADNQETALRDCTATVNALRQVIDHLQASSPSPITWFAVLPIRTRAWRPWNQNGKTMPLRFSAASQIKVKFSDFAALAQFANVQGSAPFVKLEGVDWTLTELTKTRVQEQVLAEAVRDATNRATQIAKAAGVGPVTPLEITDPGLLSGVHGSSASAPIGAAFATRAAAGAPEADAVDLLPEDVELAAQVHARFTAD